MKIAFVVGFYDPVKETLDNSYSEHQARGSLGWIRQREPHKEADLTEVSSRFFDAIQRAESIRIILFVPRGREWVIDRVNGIIASGKQRKAGLECDLVTFDNAGDRDGVLASIAAFGLPALTEVDRAMIRAKIPAGKVLCVSLAGKTSITDALQRAGFTTDAIAECVEEERIVGGRNSNLLQTLSSRSAQNPHLLYAYEGLRTLSPGTKKKFAKCWERSNAAQVVDQFKKWILE